MDAIDLALVTTRLRQILDGLDEQPLRAGRHFRHSLADPGSGDTLMVGSRSLSFGTGEALMTVPFEATQAALQRVERVQALPVIFEGKPVFNLLATAFVTGAEHDKAQDDWMRRGQRQLFDVIEQWTAPVVVDAINEFNHRAAAACQRIAASLPPGTWKGEDWVDSDGVVDEAIRVAVDLTVGEEGFTLDFGRSADRRAGGVNLSSGDVGLMCLEALTRALPLAWTPGTLGPVRIVTRRGSILDQAGSDSSNSRDGTAVRLVEAVIAALGKVPTIDGACAAGGASIVLEITPLSRDRSLAVAFEGGLGATGIDDGMTATHRSGSGVEEAEAAFPVTFVLSTVRPDSGGAGRHRGATGWTHEIEIRDAAADIRLVGDRGKYGPPGIAAGREGAPTRLMWWDGGVACDPPMISRIDGLRLARGQRLRIDTAGGGGHGRARLRDPALVAKDVRDGYVTPGGAKRDYGLEIDRSGRIVTAGSG